MGNIFIILNIIGIFAVVLFNAFVGIKILIGLLRKTTISKKRDMIVLAINTLVVIIFTYYGVQIVMMELQGLA